MRLIDMIRRELIILAVILFFILFCISIKITFGAQIVCIDKETLRSGICALDDIVSIQEDNVELTGAGYENFKIITVQGMDKASIEMVLSGNKVDTETDSNNPDIEYWYDANRSNWYKVINKPKYHFSAEDITSEEIINLGIGALNPAQILEVINKIKDKIPLDPNNSISLRARLREKKGFDFINILNADMP